MYSKKGFVEIEVAGKKMIHGPAREIGSYGNMYDNDKKTKFGRLCSNVSDAVQNLERLNHILSSIPTVNHARLQFKTF